MRHFGRYFFTTAIDLLCACFLIVRMRCWCRLYRFIPFLLFVPGDREGRPYISCRSGRAMWADNAVSKINTDYEIGPNTVTLSEAKVYRAGCRDASLRSA